ncbi:trimethylamine N-oxide reductase system protein TorE [Veronia pacifica]|uniref:Trimethylamine N-oxide reductase system protein TorE n=1 Tax=Veronia pacifica TaxID=1080227 RepID=A0A1C3ESB6_9GAMM|nr:trimethylamine N-oxide reductase system protein TorE [Veronia pacifica]ODA36131.1 trimethylamine N-oxide reductase system protein TorE [Veronia pacifica]
MQQNEPSDIQEIEKRSFEWRAFFFITVILFPVLSIMVVGGYGFLIWMSQVFFFGPPGHG